MDKVLIADDEPGALKALKYLLDWESYGFTIAGEAANGREALDLLKDGDYALLVTDIRMPGIGGLDLIREVRSFSGIPILVMSGFGEFEYVKAGLRYGIKDYLLKPVTEEDMDRVLRDVREDLARERTLHRQLYHGMQAMRNQALRKWASGAMRAKDAEERFRLLELGLDPNRHAVCCLLAEMDFMDESDVSLTDAEIQIRRFAVLNIMEDVVGSGGYVFEQSEERYGVLLCGGRDGLNGEDALAAADALRSQVSRYAGVSVTIGIGDVVWPASQVARSYAVAERMLDRKFFAGQNAVIRSGSFDEEAADGGEADVRELQPLLDAVTAGDELQVHLCLKRQMERFAAGGRTPAQVRAFMLELLVLLFHLLMKEGHRPDRLFKTDPNDYKSLLEAKTIAQSFAYAERMCVEAIALRTASRPPKPVTTVQAVKDIVAAEFGSTAISLKAIAEQIYMNPAYLGQLFKTSEGVSFNDYLLRVRMEKAKELLRRTDKKAFEVATDVGYRELDWFYKKFKAYTGLSTGEYRSAQDR
ncbi:response regulator [Cohnella nanjingensis]|uniref:Response regulator n=1 Tax=Cohnella nanjingensis TaxID=1387779 RepID=A0A7X0RQ64_9BACL|nr:response regulator [Cohnella nanjingensis]MBB6671628.1 response regulator [Cohnella nanjingensis]